MQFFLRARLGPIPKRTKPAVSNILQSFIPGFGGYFYKVYACSPSRVSDFTIPVFYFPDKFYFLFTFVPLEI